MATPAYLPVRAADLREDLHAGHRATTTPRRSRRATQVGLKVRALQAAASRCPPSSRPPSTRPRSELFGNVRGIFGGKLAQATSGAAPIAEEILEFFFACGVPVLEGYGMTETSTVATTSTVADHRSARSAARCPGSEIRIADDGEVLAARPEHLPGLLQQRRHAVVRRGRRRLAAHRRPRLARRGRLPLHHRPQEGHHHHGGRQEPHAGEPRERPQALALDLPGRHARRPPARTRSR